MSSPFEPEIEIRLTDKNHALTEALVEAALQLGVDPSRESTRLQDAIDVDSLLALVDASDNPASDLQVSFDIWGIRYVVTPEKVAASRRD
ncbi:hypothetical protein [Haloferax profundi]|nr:hypothetical protein [Haloferax profundi]